jgi:hypothetical protein
MSSTFVQGGSKWARNYIFVAILLFWAWRTVRVPRFLFFRFSPMFAKNHFCCRRIDHNGLLMDLIVVYYLLHCSAASEIPLKNCPDICNSAKKQANLFFWLKIGYHDIREHGPAVNWISR